MKSVTRSAFVVVMKMARRIVGIYIFRDDKGFSWGLGMVWREWVFGKNSLAGMIW